MISRRESLLAIFSLPVLLARIDFQKVRELDPSQVSRNCTVEGIGDGKTRWEFPFYCTQKGHRLSTDEKVYFNGAPFGAPTVRGVVKKIEMDHATSPYTQYVVVEG